MNDFNPDGLQPLTPKSTGAGNFLPRIECSTAGELAETYRTSGGAGSIDLLNADRLLWHLVGCESDDCPVAALSYEDRNAMAIKLRDRVQENLEEFRRLRSEEQKESAQ